MTISEIRTTYLEYCKKHGHTVVPSSPLVLQNDPTTLFTASGMQPMLPYLLGQKHPQGTRIADSQKCFRSNDIDDIGDNRHTTCFEMLGNWSLGDYFRKEQIPFMFSFLVDVLGIDPERLYVTTFVGDPSLNIPRDTESVSLWQEQFASKGIDAPFVEIGTEEDGYKKGMQDGRIFAYDAKKNWWSRSGVPANMPVGEPGGGDSEMFYEFPEVNHDTKFGEHCHVNCDCGRYIEIGNNVFMEYVKNADGTFSPLPQKNIDFGGGLERIAMAANRDNDVFTAAYAPLVQAIESLSQTTYSPHDTNTKAFRIIADHIKAVVFLLVDGVTPSNKEQGYFLRRLLRRAILNADKLHIPADHLQKLVAPIALMYLDVYPEINAALSNIEKEISNEESKFRKTLVAGLKEFEKGIDPFILFTTYGFPIELTVELAHEQGKTVDVEKFKADLLAHSSASRAGAEQKFKGGLADTSEITVRYHTATHLLHQALFDVLGQHVAQKGSNITAERLRFDFTHGEKMTPEQIQAVEAIVNEKIASSLPVNVTTLPTEDALKTGARHLFGDKYGDSVNVYYIGPSLEAAYSKEFCGGPHVTNTKEIGTFKIVKEEAVAAGVRRIKAVIS